MTEPGTRPSPPPRIDTTLSTTFHVFGVPIQLHFTFVVLIIFVIVGGVSGGQSALGSALYVSGLVAAVLIHELGHASLARYHGIRTLEIVMYPIGGVARLERQPSAREELSISLIGPLVNLAIAGALLGWLALRGPLASVETLQTPSDANVVERLAAANLFLGLFNLLPAYPMDGGRALRATLALRRPWDEATQIAAAAGRGLAIVMGLAGLLGGQTLLVFVALFVYLGALHEGAMAQSRRLTAGYTVRAAMISDFRTLSHGDTIRAAGDLLLSTSQQDFPVLHAGAVVGLLTRKALLRAMMAEGPGAFVAGAMDRNFLRLPPDTDLSEAMAVLAGPGTCALVMDGDTLLGLVTPENLTEFLLLRQATTAHRSTAPG